MSLFLRLLSTGSGLSPDDVLKIATSAPRRYKLFYIKKRSGGRRLIAHPAREVKLLQRVALERVLSELPVHQAAMAYREGTSIRDNAAVHRGTTPLIKLDFRDFFPSILDGDWISYCSRFGVMDADDAKLSAKLFFRRAKGSRNLRLSIGAPSSPMLSNILLAEFDTYVCNEAKRRDINYTRYADDMTFSGQRLGMLKDMIKIVEQAKRNVIMPKLSLNREKTVYATTAFRRSVTGLVLTNDGGISLGRDRKRSISAAVDHANRGLLSKAELLELCGLLGFAKVAEPDFLDRMIEKYGKAIIQKIQKARSQADPNE